MAEAFQWPDGKRGAVSVSFDDARGDTLENGLGILDRHEVKATFYIVENMYEKRVQAWKDVAASGHELGNHSVCHPCSGNFGFSDTNMLENYTIEQITSDIDDATHKIEDTFGFTPQTFAYPCGQKFVGRGRQAASYVPVVAERFVAGRGFRDESTNLPAVCDLAQLCGEDFDCKTFEQIEPFLGRTAESGRWVVFVGHGVGDGGGQVVLRSMLDQLCAYISDPDNGLWADTVANIGTYVRDHQDL